MAGTCTLCLPVLEFSRGRVALRHPYGVAIGELMSGGTVNNHIRYKKTGGSKLLRMSRQTIMHPHNFIQYIKFLGTIGLLIHWFTDHCSMWVSKSNSAARVPEYSSSGGDELIQLQSGDMSTFLSTTKDLDTSPYPLDG